MPTKTITLIADVMLDLPVDGHIRINNLNIATLPKDSIAKVAEHLREMKRKLPHGKFTDYCKSIGINIRTAQRIMKRTNAGDTANRENAKSIVNVDAVIATLDEINKLDLRRDRLARGILKEIAAERRCTVPNISILLRRGNEEVVRSFTAKYNRNRDEYNKAIQEVRDAIAA